MAKVVGMQKVVEIETTENWLKRMADECKKEMPLLSTKVNGKIVKVNFRTRLKEIYRQKGKAGVIAYLAFAVKDYNKKIESHGK